MGLEVVDGRDLDGDWGDGESGGGVDGDVLIGWVLERGVEGGVSWS